MANASTLASYGGLVCLALLAGCKGEGPAIGTGPAPPSDDTPAAAAKRQSEVTPPGNGTPPPEDSNPEDNNPDNNNPDNNNPDNNNPDNNNPDNNNPDNNNPDNSNPPTAAMGGAGGTGEVKTPPAPMEHAGGAGAGESDVGQGIGGRDTGQGGMDASEPDDTTEPDPQEEEFPELPIPILFIGLIAPDAPDRSYPAPYDFEGCPTIPVNHPVGATVDHPVWSDCAAELATAEANAKFQELLDTDIVFFESAGYRTEPHESYHSFDTRAEVSEALTVLNESALAAPGRITAVISNWNHAMGGLSRRDAAVNDEAGIVLALSQTLFAAGSLTHELGHVVGFEHTNQDTDSSGTLEYGLCDGGSAPFLPDCTCDGNIMAAGADTEACVDCPLVEESFVTETHGDFFRDQATCWFNTRRFLGANRSCGVQELATCSGYDNHNVECVCENDGTTQVPIATCELTAIEINQILVGCNEEGFAESCRNVDILPGVSCAEDPDGAFECECWNNANRFKTERSCAQLTQDEVYDACLGLENAVTCESNDGAVNCVESGPDTLSCICPGSGTMFEGSGVELNCGTANMADLAASCQ